MFSPYNRPCICPRVKQGISTETRFPLFMLHWMRGLWCRCSRIRLRSFCLNHWEQVIPTQIRGDQNKLISHVFSSSVSVCPPRQAYVFKLQWASILKGERRGRVVQTWDSIAYEETDGLKKKKSFQKILALCDSLLLQVHFYFWNFIFVLFKCCNYRNVHLILLEVYTVIKVLIVDVIISY